MSRKFAEGTVVSVPKSRAEIEDLLIRYGADESEFLAHFVLPNGNTVGAEVTPRLAEMRATGASIPLLSGEVTR